ncbi:MAG: FAD-binding oxidoreductase [Acidobacteriota bacterium]|nr:FAD-binding oxidoreductase [Acidobacteriota bacterium]
MPGGLDRPRQVLIVGAGLTGAVLAWVAARSRRHPVLLASGRVGGRADSVASGVVHGIGPPGEPRTWTSMSDETLRSAARRARRGWKLLQDVLLSASRPSGLAECPHALTPPLELDGARIEHLCERLRAAGFGVELDGRDLVNPRDALVQPRRLTLELLRQARTAGAELRFGARLPRSLRAGVSDVSVALDEGERSFDTVFWTVAHSRPGVPGAIASERQVIVEERLSPGRARLPKVLGSFDGAIQLAPAPWFGPDSTLLRIAPGSESGGSAWPQLPAEWSRYAGPARRRSLAVVAGCQSPARDRVLALGGLAMWPVTSLIGACEEVVSDEAT